MKGAILLVLALAFMSQALAAPVTARVDTSKHVDGSASSTLTEEFSFQIPNFKINHQAEINTLNIKVRYRYESGILKTEYPDFRVIVKDIEGFLKNYPNKTDYWEILNKNLTLRVLQKHPVLTSITSEIQVSPSKLDRYLRTSIVTRVRSKKAKNRS